MDSERDQQFAVDHSAAQHLTFKEFVRAQADGARETWENGDPRETVPEELILDIQELGPDFLPDVRSDYELIGVLYYQFAMRADRESESRFSSVPTSWNRKYGEAAVTLWRRYEMARDKARGQ